MAALANSDKLAAVLCETIVGTVRRDGPDLSSRQFACFLIVHLDDGPHTVRGLAARLNVSKPAITRSLDRLAELGLAKRGPDSRDRRSVLVLRTRKGNDFLADLKALMTGATVDRGAASNGRGPGNGRASKPKLTIVT